MTTINNPHDICKRPREYAFNLHSFRLENSAQKSLENFLFAYLHSFPPIYIK